MARMILWALVASLFAGPVAAIARDGKAQEIALRREDDYAELASFNDDDDDSNSGDSNSRWSSHVDSNDRTGSGHTGVSRDRDRSRDDKTRDWTKDGPQDRKRDWSQNRTNDSSRNDTR